METDNVGQPAHASVPSLSGALPLTPNPSLRGDCSLFGMQISNSSGDQFEGGGKRVREEEDDRPAGDIR